MATTPTPLQMAAHVDSVAGPEYHTNVVAQTAKPQHNLEHLGWKPACCADTFGVTDGEAAP